MSQDCESNDVLVTNTDKSKGEDDIDFNVVFLVCEFKYSSMQNN
jgi:hypothetical protein